jgi:hypothetical protein
MDSEKTYVHKFETFIASKCVEYRLVHPSVITNLESLYLPLFQIMDKAHELQNHVC